MPLAKVGDTFHPTVAVANGGKAKSSTVIFNRPSDTNIYAIGDVVGSGSTANHEATNIGSTGSVIQILSAELIINNTPPPANMSTFRLHLWDSARSAILDNAAFAATAADRSKYCGYIDFPQIAAIGGGFLYTFADYVGRPIKLLSSSIFYNLVTNGAYQPASATEYQVRIEAAELGS